MKEKSKKGGEKEREEEGGKRKRKEGEWIMVCTRTCTCTIIKAIAVPFRDRLKHPLAVSLLHTAAPQHWGSIAPLLWTAQV